MIACVGLYGTMAYAVSRRTNEIGIRMALGAERRRILWMVLREVLVLAAVGLAVGLICAWSAMSTHQFLCVRHEARRPNRHISCGWNPGRRVGPGRFCSCNTSVSNRPAHRTAARVAEFWLAIDAVSAAVTPIPANVYRSPHSKLRRARWTVLATELRRIARSSPDHPTFVLFFAPRVCVGDE